MDAFYDEAALAGVALYWWWLGLALALIGVEMATLSLFLLWPGIAAALTAALAFLHPTTPPAAQIVVFAFLSMALIVAGRRYFRNGAAGELSDRPMLNNRAAQLVGRRVSALGAFEHGEGAVRLDDGQWAARLAPGASEAIVDGDALVINAVDGATLIVSPV